MIVTPHSWGWTRTLKQRRSSAPRKELQQLRFLNHVAQQAATPVLLLRLPPPFKEWSITRRIHPDHAFRVSGLRRTAKPWSHPNQPHPPGLCASPLAHSVRPGRCKQLGWEALPPLLQARTWHSFAQPLRGPRRAMVCRGQPALGSPSTPGNAEPKGQNCPTP